MGFKVVAMLGEHTSEGNCFGVALNWLRTQATGCCTDPWEIQKLVTSYWMGKEFFLNPMLWPALNVLGEMTYGCFTSPTDVLKTLEMIGKQGHASLIVTLGYQDADAHSIPVTIRGGGAEVLVSSLPNCLPSLSDLAVLVCGLERSSPQQPGVVTTPSHVWITRYTFQL